MHSMQNQLPLLLQFKFENSVLIKYLEKSLDFLIRNCGFIKVLWLWLNLTNSSLLFLKKYFLEILLFGTIILIVVSTMVRVFLSFHSSCFLFLSFFLSFSSIFPFLILISLSWWNRPMINYICCKILDFAVQYWSFKYHIWIKQVPSDAILLYILNLNLLSLM